MKCPKCPKCPARGATFVYFLRWVVEGRLGRYWCDYCKKGFNAP